MPQVFHVRTLLQERLLSILLSIYHHSHPYFQFFSSESTGPQAWSKMNGRNGGGRRGQKWTEESGKLFIPSPVIRKVDNTQRTCMLWQGWGSNMVSESPQYVGTGGHWMGMECPEWPCAHTPSTYVQRPPLSNDPPPPRTEDTFFLEFLAKQCEAPGWKKKIEHS